MSYVSGRFVKANTFKNNVNNFNKAVIRGETTLLKYFNKKTAVLTGYGAGILNTMDNGKLYILCKKELREEAKKYGIKFDGNIRAWYISKEIDMKDLKNLMNLSITLNDKEYKIMFVVVLHIDVDKEIDLAYYNSWGYSDEEVFQLFNKDIIENTTNNDIIENTTNNTSNNTNNDIIENTTNNDIIENSIKNKYNNCSNKTNKINNDNNKVITGKENLLEYLNCKKVIKTMQGKGIKNKMRNDKLYIFCKKELRDQAKELGIKFDWNLKIWYIPKQIEIENLKKLMNLRISLYGRDTTAGYQDYEYEIVIPLMLYIDENKQIDTYKITNTGGGYTKKEVFKLFEKK